jgi:uncharacterized protein
MRTIPKEQVIRRIRTENPWWDPPHRIDTYYSSMSRRAYFTLFAPLVLEKTVRRAVVLMGPRRVGKTVMIYQMIQRLIDSGLSPRKICYITIEHPIYNGLGLEELFSHCREAAGVDGPQGCHVFFDEIQYLSDWEVHLKLLVDTYKDCKFVASGSAAAALRLKSIESGAGRFTEFLLPPLTFHEYIDLLNKGHLLTRREDKPGEEEEEGRFTCSDLEELNKLFLDYLNYGGYPEVVFSEIIRSDPGRYIRNDIIDKVLLRNLPSLYGIQDVQELNSLFTTLAFNTADEVSLEGLSARSGVAKNTIKKYIEYLEAAFLVKRVERVDRNAKRFQRANHFKIYLTNPSMWSALFSPISKDSAEMGSLIETAVFAQWFHTEATNLHYARWDGGEVDIVNLDSQKQNPWWVVEVKWSDRYSENPGELSALIGFCKAHGLETASVTTISISHQLTLSGVTLSFIPASIYCYTVGRNLVEEKKHARTARPEVGKRPRRRSAPKP